MRRWGATAVGLVLVTMLLSGDTPWRYTLFGLVLPPDFAQDLAAASVFASNQNPYDVGIARTHAELMQAPEAAGYRYFPHPPLLFLLLLPMADFTLSHAAAVWCGVSLGLLFLLAVVLAESYSAERHRGGNLRTVLAIFGALVVWPPVQYNLAKGQWSILVALLLALCWYSHVRGQYRAAGVSLGLASAVKLFPVLLGIYFLWRTPRALVWMTAAIAVALGLPFLWMGVDTVWMFVQQSQANVTYWETFPAVTYSIHGALARLMVGGQWARPLVHAPLVARVLTALSAVVLIVIAMRSLRRHETGDDHEGARFAAWISLLVVVNPLAMAHSGVILALPIVLIARALSSDARVWPKVAWTAGVALVSIPGHTLIFLASNPIEPWQGLALIALPLWGTLLLFSAAIAAGASRSVISMPASHAAPSFSIAGTRASASPAHAFTEA